MCFLGLGSPPRDGQWTPKMGSGPPRWTVDLQDGQWTSKMKSGTPRWAVDLQVSWCDATVLHVDAPRLLPLPSSLPLNDQKAISLFTGVELYGSTPSQKRSHRNLTAPLRGWMTAFSCQMINRGSERGSDLPQAI